MKKKAKKSGAKKPRTLNAVWADAQCRESKTGQRVIKVQADGMHFLTAKQALRLSQWLAEAAAWKGEE